MKKLVMSALLLGALQATGCIIQSDDSGDDVPDGTATINVAWSIEDEGQDAECPIGATTAAFNSHLAGRADPFVDLFDCADLAGVAEDLPAGDYDLWIDFTDDSGATLYGQSGIASVTLFDEDVADASFRVENFTGYFDISWTISGSNCVSSDGGVSVLSTLAGTTLGIDDIFLCEDGESPAIATTGGLQMGDYVVAVALLNSEDQAIGDAPDVTARLADDETIVDLGTVTITLF